MGITTKTIPLLTVPCSALELRDGTWLMTGSCVMKDAVVVKENYGHSLDRLQVTVSLSLLWFVVAFSWQCGCGNWMEGIG